MTRDRAYRRRQAALRRERTMRTLTRWHHGERPTIAQDERRYVPVTEPPSIRPSALGRLCSTHCCTHRDHFDFGPCRSDRRADDSFAAQLAELAA